MNIGSIGAALTQHAARSPQPAPPQSTAPSGGKDGDSDGGTAAAPAGANRGGSHAVDLTA